MICSMASSWYLVAVLAVVVVVTAVAGEVDKQYGLIPTLPGESCRDIYQKNPYCHGKSGYYVIVLLTLYTVIWSWSVVERKDG